MWCSKHENNKGQKEDSWFHCCLQQMIKETTSKYTHAQANLAAHE